MYVAALTRHFDTLWARHGSRTAIYSRGGVELLPTVRIVPGLAETVTYDSEGQEVSAKRESLIVWKSELDAVWEPQIADRLVFTTLAGLARTVAVVHATAERVWDFMDQDGFMIRLQAVERT